MLILRWKQEKKKYVFLRWRFVLTYLVLVVLLCGSLLQLTEINRELAVLQKLEPQKLTLKKNLGQAQAEVSVHLQWLVLLLCIVQLSEVHEHLVSLEQATESDLSRARALPGVDPNTGQLRNSMEKVMIHFVSW